MEQTLREIQEIDSPTVIPSVCSNPQWEQRATDLDITKGITNTTNNEDEDTSMALSGDGKTIAISLPQKDDVRTGRNVGLVQVYQLKDRVTSPSSSSSSYWKKIGYDIMGENADDLLGLKLSLSENGHILAVTGNAWYDKYPLLSSRSFVRVYRINYSTNTWDKLGDDIPGGSSISLSKEGDILAVGETSPLFSNMLANARVYFLDTTLTNATESNVEQWNQLGSDIKYEGIGNFTSADFGQSVSLSSDGSTVAIGAPGFGEANKNSGGLVQIYSYDFEKKDFVQLGSDIFGEILSVVGGSDNGIRRESLGESVSLSENGRIVAVGTLSRVKIFQYQKINGTSNNYDWRQLGNDINGDDVEPITWTQNQKGGTLYSTISLLYNDIGTSISLSDDGHTIALCADRFMPIGLVYKYNDPDWTRVGSELLLAENLYQLEFESYYSAGITTQPGSIFLSGDGNTVGIIGEKLNSDFGSSSMLPNGPIEGGDYAGTVRVFSLTGCHSDNVRPILLSCIML